MALAGYAASIEMRNSYKILFEKLTGMIILGGLGVDERIILKLILNK